MITRETTASLVLPPSPDPISTYAGEVWLASAPLGIVAAEYVLGWLPRGTHSWQRFLRPAEAARPLRRAGLSVEDLTGVVYDPLRDRFRLSRDPAVNYMLFATRD